jgi:hypothetical protein
MFNQLNSSFEKRLDDKKEMNENNINNVMINCKQCEKLLNKHKYKLVKIHNEMAIVCSKCCIKFQLKNTSKN